MASTDTKIVFIKDYIKLTGDPDKDLLISALAAAEIREGERKGWDKAPQVWELRLNKPGQLSIMMMPDHLWHTGHQNPSDDLAQLASPLPDPPLDVPQLPLGTSLGGLAALAFMSEAWARNEKDAPVDVPEPPGRGDPYRLNEFHPNRIEVRTVCAVDINGVLYAVFRERGKKPALEVCDIPGVRGQVPQSLHKLIYAIRASWSA
jgi:hypothetical protein